MWTHQNCNNSKGTLERLQATFQLGVHCGGHRNRRSKWDAEIDTTTLLPSLGVKSRSFGWELHTFVAPTSNLTA